MPSLPGTQMNFNARPIAPHFRLINSDLVNHDVVRLSAEPARSF
jgi:hypothetical protein